MTDSELKAGVKTSEFWLTMLVTIGTLLIASGLIAAGSVAIKVTALIVALLQSYGYVVKRSEVKAEALKTAKMRVLL